MKFTKRHLLKAIKPNKSHKDIVNAIFLEINKALVRRETVMLTCFGKFFVIKSQVKFGQNFQTKQRIPLPPQYRIKFQPSKTINKIVNERNLI